MKTSKVLLLLLIPLFAVNSFAQTHINRLWTKQSGNPLMLQWSNSITTSNNDLVTVGNSLIAGEGANILTTRYDKEGNVLWQHDFNSSVANNDYGIALSEDNNGNIYVVGTTDNNTTTDYNVVILKYNSAGTLLWSKIWASSYNLKDIATGITTDNTGNIYICATSETPTTSLDFLTLKLDDSGNILWKNRYDKAGLKDAPIAISLMQNGNIYVTGVSASATNNWDYTVVDLSNTGTYLNEKRINISSSQYDQPLAYAKDNNENIYITGKTSTDGINYNITTAKILSNFTIGWVKTIDFSGKEDVGNAIKVDNNGNVYVGGYVTKSNNAKSMFLVKYGAQGNQLWKKVESAKNPIKDAVIKSLEKDNEGNIYVAGDKTEDTGLKQGILSKISSNGNYKWRRKINTSGNNEPTSIHRANDGTLYVTALKGTVSPTYQAMRYSMYKQDTAKIYSPSGKPLFKAHELIVRFKRNALDTSIINNTKIEYGNLQQFLTPQAYAEFAEKFNTYCKGCKFSANAIKVFPLLTTHFKTATNRLGETVTIPDFWTTLLLDYEGSIDIQELHDFLKTTPDLVAYSEPNYFIWTASANDPYYSSKQKSLHKIDSTIPYTRDINIEEAWSIFPDAGYPFIKCGVFDDGIQYRHEDFGYDSTADSSKIKGWNFESNIPLTQMQDSSIYFKHGTACAGIIGALRNNNTGIAGIAGGNMNNGNTGVSLYGLRIFQPLPGFPHGVPFPDSLGSYSPIQYVYNAIVMSAIDSNLNYTYGINLSSNSWRVDDSTFAGSPSNPFFTDTNITLLREAVHFVNRMQVTFVACRGNEGYNSNSYPAILDDDWVLSVGGSGKAGDYEGDGGYSWSSSYGQGMDVIAPSTSDLVYTTSRNPQGYRSFNGTSAATPHVAGVVALLMSYLDDSVPSYNNLAPEDCEHIIQLSATDVGPADYDSLNGWGRLNAGKALKLVEKPSHKVLHFGTKFYPNTKKIMQTTNHQIIYLKEQTQNKIGQWLDNGKYKVDAYKITAAVHHNLPAGDSIMYYWSRPSMSTVFGPIKNDSLLPRERISINGLNQDSCSMTGYVYHVFDLSGYPICWLPFDTTLSKARFEYTILTKERQTLGISKETLSSNSWAKLYPNPSEMEQYLILKLSQSTKLDIMLYDMDGRLIKSIFNRKANKKMIKLKINISGLSRGMYFYCIRTDTKIKSLKFIKQ